MNLQRQSLYHVEWQALRVQLLGNWHTLADVNRNLSALNKYSATAYATDSWDMILTRAYQVTNLLDAVRMGYHGMRIEGSPIDQAVVEGRVWFQHLYHTTRSPVGPAKFVVPTEEEIIEDCRTIGRNRTQEIIDNLLKRQRFALNKAPGIDKAQKMRYVTRNRPELLWAIETMSSAWRK